MIIGSTPRHIPKGTGNRYVNKTHIQMFTAVWFIIATRWNQSQYLSTGKWMDKTWNIHTECYSANKRNNVLIHVTTWMNTENMPSERSQIQQDNIVWFCSYDISRIGKCTEKESRLVIARARERGGGWGGIHSDCLIF